MSLLDRELVPPAQSRASSSATERPRVAASRAAPAPTTPPPTMTTSNACPAMAASAALRSAGPSRPGRRSSIVMASGYGGSWSVFRPRPLARLVGRHDDLDALELLEVGVPGRRHGALQGADEVHRPVR